MGNNIDSYCHDCEQVTSFTFDGDGWECDSCGAYDTQGNHCDSESPYYHD